MNFKIRIFYAAFFILSFCGFAEKIPFVWHTEFDDKDIVVPIEFNEKQFGQKSAFEYNHEIARLACFFSVAAYSDVSLENNNLLKNYSLLGINKKDIELHYNVNYDDSMWGNDQVAFSIASKEINSSKGKQNLIIVSIRGTPLNANEWLSNLNISDTTHTEEIIHNGFGKATHIVHSALISYLLRHRIDPTDSFLLVTGHSRGAAVSNLLAAKIVEDNFFKTENCYVYTFASPNVTTADDALNKEYGFIWNIVNAEDIVPTVPLYRDNWHFRKYGHTVALINYTNVSQEKFDSEYIPRIDRFYKQFCNEKYHPFKTGPFFPIVVAKLLTHVAENVEMFYSGSTHLHEKASSLMSKVFPAEKEYKVETKEKTFTQKIISSINRKTHGMIDYVEIALGDMHSKEMYLSFMLAFDENEIFSDTGYTLVIIKGAEEALVFDDDGNVFLKVYDGMYGISKQKMPLVAVPARDNQLLIGVPSNREFNLVFTDETLLYSPIEVFLEHYTAAGVYHGSTKPQRLFVRKGRAYKFRIGQGLLDHSGVREEKLSFEASRFYINKYGLNASYKYSYYPEISISNDFDLYLGMHFGVPNVYGTVLLDQQISKLGRSTALLLGVGRQMTLYKTIYFDLELFSKISFNFSDNKTDKKICLVPSLRGSFSYKILNFSKILIGFALDVHLKDFNDEAFSAGFRRHKFSSWKLSDKIELVPNIQIGFKF
ncbi:MAG: lipase family protein [Treponema sp.]|nr:lipase family protein [Treponema sp.]